MDTDPRPPRRALRRFLHALLLALPALAAAPQAQASGPPAYDVVGVLRVEAPQAGTFTLHGTLPLPRGAWVNADVNEPFYVVGYDGLPVPTQCEVVSRYPSPSDGVDVAEVIARVRRPAQSKPGDMLVYRVLYLPHAAPSDPPASVNALYSGPDLPDELRQLLSNPVGLVIEAVDAFGNSYRSAPFDGTGSLSLLKHGEMEAQLRVSSTLTPSPAVAGPEGTLPHHLGVTAYLTTFAEESLVGIDLRFHNAHSGVDKNDPMDDPLGRVYFEAINLYVPTGWALVQDYLDPFLSLPTSLPGGFRLFPLVSKTSEGLHGMEWQAQFHRRLILGPDNQIAAAQGLARGEGLGFASRGESSLTGAPFWSWWNPDTARWFPQSHQLPSLDHVDAAKLDSDLAKEVQKLEEHLLTGSGSPDYPIFSPVLGHAHPYGVKYGGMSGGTEIHLYDGLRALERASLDGYRAALMTHRMYSDRMPNVLFDGDGQPAAVEDWVIPLDGGKDYLPFWHFGKPDTVTTDPFGVTSAPDFQVQYVEGNGLDAPFLAELKQFDHIDFQHLIRYTRAAKVLAWLANDSLAKDDLMAQTEVFHMSYHDYFNTPYQHMQVTGLKYDRDYVQNYPGVGFTFGRGEGWGLDCITATYATAPTWWRNQNRAWIDKIADVLVDGQASCTGFIQATVGEKFFDGNLRARQIIEQSIVENALLGLIETVYRGDDPARTGALADTLKRSVYSMLHPIAWEPGKDSPWAHTAVGPLDDALPPYCDISELPNPGTSDWQDSYQNWSSFAYGFELTGDPVFLEYAKIQAGGDLFFLYLDGAKNIENRAALIALLQKAAGLL